VFANVYDKIISLSLQKTRTYF